MNKLTPLILTHYSPKAEYGDLAPPNSELVERTIASLYHRSRQNNFRGLERPILVYNEPYKNHEWSNTYKKNLFKYCKSQNIKLCVQKNDGIRSGLTKLIELMDTQYGFFLEHDWEIVQPIDFKYIVDILHNHNEVNLIRLNPRQDCEDYDPHLISSSNHEHLCKSGVFSNNPHFFDIKHYYNWVKNSKPDFKFMKGLFEHPHRSVAIKIGAFKNALLEYVANNPQKFKTHSNVEYVLDIKYKYDINKYGFEGAHKDWGIYVYGRLGDEPYINHLGRNVNS